MVPRRRSPRRSPTIDTRPDASPEPAHARPAAEVAASLGVDPDEGLDPREIATRRERWGPNRIEGREAPSRWSLLAEEFRDVLVWVLLAAALISGLLLGEWVDAGVILAIVVLNAALGYVLHARAESALAALREMVAPEATVIRAGDRVRVAAADVVPGDVLQLAPGDRVPADARLLWAHRLATNEAVLTGESLPVDKQDAPVEADAPLAERASLVFTGTTVARGRGLAVVVATGSATEMGQIAALMEAQEVEETPLQVLLASVGRRLALLAGVVAVVVFALGTARDLGAEEMFLTAVALAVAAIPEGLPAAVTITLAGGTQRMAREHALVRRLPAVETLGAADVVCTDKTGTLTRNELRVATLIGPEGTASEEIRAAEASPRFARVAALCNDAHPAGEGFTGDPVDVALLHAVVEAGGDVAALREELPRLDEIAFDSERKRMSTLHRVDGGYLLLVKGAPEVVLTRCTGTAVGDHGAEPLGDDRRRDLAAAAEALAARGLRTLVLADRAVAQPPRDLEEDEHDLTFVAVVAMLDDLREEAASAVAQARQAGIRVVMITGDHVETARTIAGGLGLDDGEVQVLEGRDLHEMADDEIDVERWGAYARVDPADKVKIVRAWKRRDAVVAMTGDGVNDAPALRAADIGVAMGSGTDVGKDASEMILTDDNFATIVGAIREGRRIFCNLQNLIFFLLAANIAEVLVVTFGLLLFSSEGSPLLPTQILWVNLITDGLPVLGLAVDPAPRDVMTRPPFGSRSLLGPADQVHLVGRGAVIALASAGALLYGHELRDLPWAHVRTIVFTTLVVSQLVYAYAVRRRDADGHVTRPGANRFLAWSVVASVALQAAVVQTGAGESLFETVAMTVTDWAVIAGLSALVYLALAQPWRRPVEVAADDRAGSA